MSEGFFHPGQLQIPGITSDEICAAMVRILPRTVLILDVAKTPEQARNQARNESLPDGSECWYRFFTSDDVAKVNDPEFAMGMVRHEFARAVKSGLQFPVTVPLDGGGSGFSITPGGHVLTNYHLVTAEIANYGREGGVIDREVPCRSLRAQVAYRTDAGHWQWRNATALWLVSNPPESRAISQDGNGQSQLREDTALLRVDPPPSAFLRLSERSVAVSEPLWMAGFPLRSARKSESLESVGYTDADGTLRISCGSALDVNPEGYFASDVDGSMGNSGSPVLDASGRVVGMFSRASGNGPRNAFEYGHMSRINVSAKLAADGLHLASLLPSN
ncbi:MAG: serine protease [Betaproteobacteria bacterium]|nr:MAG: serine protease [Betaproteobacteria bacterium]